MIGKVINFVANGQDHICTEKTFAQSKCVWLVTDSIRRCNASYTTVLFKDMYYVLSKVAPFAGNIYGLKPSSFALPDRWVLFL